MANQASDEERQFVKKYDELCQVLYTTADQQQRQQAEQQLAQIVAAPAYVSQARSVLALSELPVSQHHVARMLKNLFTERWSTISYQVKVGMLYFVVHYLSQKGLSMQRFVALEVCLLAVRITKLGWFEGTEMKDLVSHCQKFMGSAPHAPIGLKLLMLLTTEMDEVMAGNTLSQHRKISTSFRDRNLLQVFQMGLTALRQVLDGGNIPDAQREAILSGALELSHKCLTFDFIGTQPSSEKTDDAGTVQVPNTWRELFESEGILRLFFSVYRSTSPATAKIALQCLTQVASVRRSVFTGTTEREDFLGELMRGICEIIRTGTGLQDSTNHHELCRLLARMKANFQLKQIIKCPVYPEWIQLLKSFTDKSFQAWQWAPNSVYYLLTLWSRLVASIAYLQQNEDTKLESVAPAILEAYVRSRLSSVDVVLSSDGTVDDPLEAPCLREEMEALPTLGRLRFSVSSNMLTSLFDPLASAFEQRLLNLSKTEAFMFESKLTWMVQMIAAILGGRLATSSTPEADKLDGELSARLFRLMKLHDQRVQSPGFSPSTATPRLELALLRFLQEFRKVYIGDYATAASSIYVRLSELLGLNDPNAVLALILQKICNNLRFWAKNKFIVERTLSLCNTISSGYSSGKLLRKVELTNHLFGHHTSQYFPFLDVPANSRGRTNFYNTLAKLLYLDCSVRDFNAFMAPFGQVFLRLLSINGPEQFRQPVVMAAVTGLLRDMRGIVDACVSGPTYNMFFDWIYENHAPNGARYSDVLVRIADVFYDVPDVTSPLLKFMAEFVLNKSSRVAFDSSSPNGILLFRLASEVLVAYGTKILETRPPPQKLYNARYKGTWICLRVLRNALQGGFCNYGVFQLYKDPALANALNIVFKLMFSVPLSQVMVYPKSTDAHFAFLDTLCSEHTSTVATLDQAIFRQMLESFKEGLGALDQGICAHCCNSVDKIADFFYHNQDKDTVVANGIKALVKEQMPMFNELLSVLFQILCFEPQCLFQWSISRPMLSLIVINPPFFQQLKAKLCQSMLTPEMGAKMGEALHELMVDIEQNLSSKNRDLFTQRLSLFRHSVQAILNAN